MRKIRLIWSTGQTSDLFVGDNEASEMMSVLAKTDGSVPAFFQVEGVLVGTQGLRLILDLDKQVALGRAAAEEEKSSRPTLLAVRAEEIVSKLLKGGKP